MVAVLLVSLGFASPTPHPGPMGIESDLVPAGRLAERFVDDGADLVVWYGGEQEGELGPCGCSVSAQGGLARLTGWVEASRERAPEQPTVLLNPGGWLTTALADDSVSFRSDTHVKNRAMVDALAGWDALNVGFRDLPWLDAHGFPRTAVSANVRATEGEGPAAFRLIERGGLTIAVTGVTGLGLQRIQPKRFAWADPVESVRLLVPTLAADLVVVLAYETRTRTVELARIPGVGLVIETGEYAQFDPANREGHALWARAWRRSERLGELRVKVSEGLISDAMDRSIPLDDRVRADRELTRLTRDTAAAVLRVQQAMR